MVFKFAGIPSAGYRDDGRSLILRWPISKPPDSLHAVESWHHATSQALKRWNLPIQPLSAKKTLGLRLADRNGTEAMKTIDAAGLEPGQFILIAPKSEEHTTELQSLIRILYAVLRLKKKKQHKRFRIKDIT